LALISHLTSHLHGLDSACRAIIYCAVHRRRCTSADLPPEYNFLLRYQKRAWSKEPSEAVRIHVQKGSKMIHVQKGSKMIHVQKGCKMIHVQKGSKMIHVQKGSKMINVQKAKGTSQ
jgi:hypothetical protein